MKLQSGQVAVVTGGASGIGLALSRQFAARGLAVVLVDVEADVLARVRDELEQTGATVLAVPTDVSDSAQMASLAARVDARFGRVDVLCNNAGVALDDVRPLWEFDERDWRWILDVNLLGVILGLRHFLPTLIRQGYGHVVNTASLSGLEVRPFDAPYTVSKHGVVVLSESLRSELASMAPGVGVSVLCPGITATRIRDAVRNRPAHLVPTESAPSHDEAFVNQMTSVMMGENAAGAEVLPPEAVAAQALAAIEDGTFYIAPHPGTLELVRKRVEPLLAALTPSPSRDPSEAV